jgi:flagellar hook-basal body complex protein FliE
VRSVLFLAKGISVCGEGEAMAGPLSQMPMDVHPDPKADNTVAEQFIERIDGETTFDQVAKAQSSMPQVVKRITELENCLWALAEELTRLDPRNSQIERAKLLLKNRLEILDSSKPFQKDQAERKRDALETFASLLHEAISRASNTEQETGKTVTHENYQEGDDIESPSGTLQS